MRLIISIFLLGLFSCFDSKSKNDCIQRIYPELVEKIVEFEREGDKLNVEKTFKIVVLRELITTDLDHIAYLLHDEYPSLSIHDFELSRDFIIDWTTVKEELLKRGIVLKIAETIEDFIPEIDNRIYFISKPYLDDRKGSGFVWFSIFESADWNYWFDPLLIGQNYRWLEK